MVDLWESSSSARAEPLSFPEKSQLAALGVSACMLLVYHPYCCHWDLTQAGQGRIEPLVVVVVLVA